ncbi:hypothetical protein EGR_04305 [Echinococcus granulosus]|uniref:Uncharacterized protein n=1 Tax=Echinococcus granulosus TaxID=6210 RepID=W6UIE2_ECHGR|nr:hypothetical protein EGR_04305 [Echinococcus granulosus]EUB60866.1 hypothetical protein EGR_04305 [Echinococcus granulosus]
MYGGGSSEKHYHQKNAETENEDERIFLLLPNFTTEWC